MMISLLRDGRAWRWTSVCSLGVLWKDRRESKYGIQECNRISAKSQVNSRKSVTRQQSQVSRKSPVTSPQVGPSEFQVSRGRQSSSSDYPLATDLCLATSDWRATVDLRPG